ncbi:MAG: endolytic transglycosylase MltG, partial [Candidatus Microsaccharimonas sp.]
YTRIQGVQNNLQAGSYRLSPSETMPEVVDHLSNGNVDTFQLTFLPGTTLEKQKEVIMNAGYSEQEVEAAFAKSYSSPLFEGKPASADLEGYIFPETYNFGTDSSVEAILEHVFDEFYSVVQENDLVAAYKAQGLSLFEGIVMASIIQKEAVGGDERQIAQVFLTRHSIGMALGSDPTYQYITDKLGVPRDINYDSPYNTRRYPGIPPGPIANAGVTVLKAVGNPAEGDYLYFLSGDDDVTYFSRTFEEHEANIRDHCQIKCQAL